MTNNTVHHKRQFHLALWPSETFTWIRIPAMIAGIIGLLGTLKYNIDRVDVLLRTINLPPIQICWLLIILSAGAYTVNLAYWMWFRNRRSTAAREQAVSATKWRTL